MVERTPFSEEPRSTNELAKRIITRYDSHNDFLRVVNSPLYLSPSREFAHRMRYFSADERERILNQASERGSVDIQYQAARSLTEIGDFSLFKELDLNPPFPGDKYLLGGCLLDIALEQSRHGQDPMPTIEAVRTLISDENLLRPTHRVSFGRIARVMQTIGANSSQLMEKATALATTEDSEFAAKYSRSEEWIGNRSRLAVDFAKNGFTDKALELVSGFPSSETVDDVFDVIGQELIQRGEIDRGLETARKTSASFRAKINADAAIKAAQLGQDYQKYAQSAKVYLVQIVSNGGGIQESIDIPMLLAKAEFIAGGNPRPYFDETVKYVMEFETLVGRTTLLVDVLKTQAETIGIQSDTLEAILDLTERASGESGEDEDLDKFDRIDMVMNWEDTIEGFVDLGLFDLAKKFLRRSNDMSSFYDDDYERTSFEINTLAKIAGEEAKNGITADELADLDPKAIRSLLSANNPQLNKALGYFGVVDQALFASLPPQTQIAVAVGWQQREIREDAEVVSPIEIYNSSKTAGTTKALVESISGNTDQASAELLRELLEKELLGERDYQTIGRILKGLIEIDDDGAKQVATTIFMDESVPAHFRLYLARKLCDSGHWDRQIISYFKSYQKRGVEVSNFMIDVKLDSLTAIITQMHTTPSLAVYRVLEKTRLSRSKEEMADLARFGNWVFLLPETDLKDKIEIFSFWAEKYENNQLNASDLERLENSFTQLSQAERDYLEHNNIDKRYPVIISLLKNLYKNPDIEETLDELSLLLGNGIFPTDSLLAFAKENGANTLGLLKALMAQTERGDFDSGNAVQRDLEYTKYLMLKSDKPQEVSYSNFSRLETVTEEFARSLNLEEQMEAESAAFEAAQLYWYVMSRVDLGHKVTVVGNRRYGDYFVVEPLHSYFEKAGVQVSSYKIGSSGSGPQTVADVFPDSFIEGLIREQPDVVIVDGTARLHEKDDSVRLPSAMNGYINWFHAFNEAAGQKSAKAEILSSNVKYQEIVQKISGLFAQTPYKFSYFVPAANDKLNVGGELIEYTQAGNDGPYVILANPVIDPRKTSGFPVEFEGHRPGYLDDPDKFVRGDPPIVAFTKTGVKQVYKGRSSESEFVNSVQNHMISVLPEMIRETDPLFK